MSVLHTRYLLLLQLEALGAPCVDAIAMRMRQCVNLLRFLLAQIPLLHGLYIILEHGVVNVMPKNEHIWSYSENSGRF